MAVHPRWRGEHDNPWPNPGRDQRFIPAGAGNTDAENTGPADWTVHPRWRGEHKYHRAGLEVDVGSSPLARGTRQAGWCSSS